MDAVDLTLIHWPSPGNAVPLKETLEALIEAKRLGLTRAMRPLQLHRRADARGDRARGRRRRLRDQPGGDPSVPARTAASCGLRRREGAGPAPDGLRTARPTARSRSRTPVLLDIAAASRHDAVARCALCPGCCNGEIFAGDRVVDEAGEAGEAGSLDGARRCA
ncbi:hypothetical protein ACRAWF_28955 [Streptomyces sp. L7]